MSDSCYRIEELAQIAALKADDPRRAHLTDCPRCRSRLAAYESFMNDDELPATANPVDADSRLKTALQEEIFGAEDPVREPARRVIEAPSGGWRQFLQWMTRPAMRPVWGVAAALLLIVVLREAMFTDRSGRTPMVLRGTDTDLAESASAVLQPDGDILFTWAAPAESDQNIIAFYNARLEEIGRIDAQSASDLLVTSSELPAGVEHEWLLWRVLYLRGGDSIGQSVLAGLPKDE